MYPPPQPGLDARLTEYPIMEVMVGLGIVPKDAGGSLEGVLPGPVLDIGCGQHAQLVEHLRVTGLETEGIDPEILDDLAGRSYLMKQTDVCIPRPDGYYGTAVSHMSHYQDGMLFIAMMAPKVGDEDPAEEHRKFYLEHVKPDLMKSLEETRRVVRPGGQLIINPAPMFWIMDVDAELKEQGYGISFADVPPVVKQLPIGMEKVGFEYLKRLILTMPE